VEKFELERRCRERGIEPIVLYKGSDLLALAEDAVERGADVIGMAGGDGSQALVASVASRHGIPMVVIPAGTRNHFALDLGVDRDDVVGALDAYEDGVDLRIDLAEVNGRVFVNNSSMGLYAKVVQSAEYRDAKIQTAAETLPDLLGPNAVPLDLRFTLPSGEQATSANLVLVSNNPYQLSHLRGASTRPRLDTGVLGVVSVLVRGAGDAEKLAALEAAGQVSRFSGWNEWTATEFVVDSGGPVEVGVDGEALTMDPPLRFVIRPGALTVRRTRAAVVGRNVTPAVHVTSTQTLGALWHTALGRPAPVP
jgi:diacylglycerol kinase family enzyme